VVSAAIPAILAAVLAGRATDGDVVDRAAMTYLALGDSYTIGEGVAPAGRWPMQLADALRERGVAIQDPRIVARTGWTTDELSAAIDAEFGADADARADTAPRFGFVTLLIGVNNQYRGRSVDEYAVQFEALLDRAIGFVDGRRDRAMVLSIPDWGVTPFAVGSGRDTVRIAQELDAYNAAARVICERRGVAFVDIAPVSRARGVEAKMLADDGCKPSSMMYSEWTADALPVALRLLRGDAR
jgi:lysophospholipase L1-like esterase